MSKRNNILLTIFILTLAFLISGCGMLPANSSGPKTSAGDKDALPEWLTLSHRSETGSSSYDNVMQYQPEEAIIVHTDDDTVKPSTGHDQSTPARPSSGTPTSNLSQPASQGSFWNEPTVRDSISRQADYVFQHEVDLQVDAESSRVMINDQYD